MVLPIDYLHSGGGGANANCPPLEYVDAIKVNAPVLARCGVQDNPCPIDGVDMLEAELRVAKVAYSGHRYLAHQGCASETAEGPGSVALAQYDASWTQLACNRSAATRTGDRKAFFGRHLV